ncbi:MAG: hypothetical protein DME25_11590, partial [Verrucomicrobia bacterium]
LCANVPLRPRHGSVGRFLPGIEYRLEPVEGVSEGGSNRREVAYAQIPFLKAEISILKSEARIPTGQAGRLLVRGPNIMRGYLNPEANARFQSLDGWYDTGDIVRVDPEGFVFILGRIRRFAKVSGEMVSLTAVEDTLSGAFPQFGLRFALAVIARPDSAKGEKLVAITNEPRLDLDQIRQAIHARGLTNLAVPREIKVLPELPRLGTGKINLRELEKLVE